MSNFIKLEKSLEIKNHVMVTDPCYLTDRGPQHNVVNLEPGVYDVYVLQTNEGTWGTRNAELCLKKQGESFDGRTTVIAPFEVGVDSGQAGVFPIGENFDEDFYDECCNVTCERGLHCGVLEDSLGVVCTSGFGDGGYECQVVLNEETKGIGLVIRFISQDESEDKNWPKGLISEKAIN